MTSNPDADGNHRLKCPRCHTEFLAHIIRDDITQKIDNTVCEACGHEGEPVEFLYHANKEATDKMVSDYVMKDIKKAFGRNRRTRIR
jgi:DNA-directed RNA polymerase subunit RPC12/RpoP